MDLLSDPFVWFCGICILTPLLAQIESGLTPYECYEYFTEPAMMFCLFLLVAVPAAVKGHILLNGKKKKMRFPNLTRYERMRARWYLLNGIIIHILMDGLVGVFKASRLFALNYAKLDRRYGDPLGSYNGSAVHIISLMELFVKGPICILLYAAYYTGSPYRDVLEFFTCVTQVYGTIVYLGQEMISGMQNFDVDYKMEFTMHYLIYFWFAIAFGCILYIIIPMYLGWKSMTRMVGSAKKSKSSLKFW